MTTFNTQLEADLAVYRGGNKARLVARCWVATKHGAECGLEADQYDRFRAEWIKATFAQLHDAFDKFLPQEYRTSTAHPYGNGGRGRQTKKANGMTEAQQAKFERFCKSPARLEKRLLKTVDYWRSLGPSEHLQVLIDRNLAAAAECARLMENQHEMAMYWEMGLRTGGDLETRLERAFKI